MPGFVLRQLDLDNKRVLALPIEQRFTFFFLGQVFNEVMALQKLLARAFAKDEDVDQRVLPLLDGANANSVLLVRLLASKIFEAKDRWNSMPVGPVLAEHFLPLFDRDGRDRLKGLNKSVDGNKWIKAVRNSHAFHYPTLAEWQPVLDGDRVNDLYIYFGDVVGNSLFAASDHIASYAMFNEAGEKDPGRAFGKMIRDLLDLSLDVGEFMQEAAIRFAERNLVAKTTAITDLTAPALFDAQIPYFIGTNQRQQ
jgi:hypothetical protein